MLLLAPGNRGQRWSGVAVPRARPLQRCRCEEPGPTATQARRCCPGTARSRASPETGSLAGPQQGCASVAVGSRARWATLEWRCCSKSKTTPTLSLERARANSNAGATLLSGTAPSRASPDAESSGAVSIVARTDPRLRPGSWIPSGGDSCCFPANRTGVWFAQTPPHWYDH